MAKRTTSTSSRPSSNSWVSQKMPTNMSTTVQATTCVMLSMQQSSAKSSAGSHNTRTSAKASRRPSTGTHKTKIGGKPKKPRSKPSTQSRANNRMSGEISVEYLTVYTPEDAAEIGRL